MSSIEMWDGVAPAWERHAAFVDEHAADATELMLARADVGPGDTVLDLACGAGGAGLAAARLAGERGRVILTDGSAEMVSAAARRAEHLPQVSAMVVDLAAIDLAHSSFHAALCRHGLMFLEDPAAALRSILELLRPGGRIAAATWDRREANPWMGVVLDAFGAQFNMEFPPPGVRGPFSLDDPAVLTELLTGAGFADVQVEAVPTPMRASSLEDWWTRVPELAGPLAIALAGMEPEVRDAIRERALAAAADVARPGPDGVELDGSILVSSGQRPA